MEATYVSFTYVFFPCPHFKNTSVFCILYMAGLYFYAACMAPTDSCLCTGYTETHSIPVCLHGLVCSACAFIHLPCYLSFRSSMKENCSVACFIPRSLLVPLYVSCVLFVREGGWTHSKILNCIITSADHKYVVIRECQLLLSVWLSAAFKPLLLTTSTETCIVIITDKLPYQVT